jgi:septum formation protein
LWFFLYIRAVPRLCEAFESRWLVFETMKLPSLILASKSPRRSELLRQCGLEFRVVPSDAAELHHDQLTAREISQINAYRKARTVAKKFPDALVIAADTIVNVDNLLYGKPSDLEVAYQMLEKLQGRTHTVVTGICLLHLRSHQQRIFSESTAVTFKPLDAVQIRRYLTQVNPLDKAGAYAIQEHGDQLIERISGSHTNVVGLPMERLSSELKSWGDMESYEAFPTLSPETVNAASMRIPRSSHLPGQL